MLNVMGTLIVHMVHLVIVKRYLKLPHIYLVRLLKQTQERLPSVVVSKSKILLFKLYIMVSIPKDLF